MLGPHGGGVANAGFCPSGSHLIEFIPKATVEYPPTGKPLVPSSVRPCYHGMAHAANLTYWRVEPEGFSFTAPGMRVNVADVMSIFHRIGALRPGWSQAR